MTNRQLAALEYVGRNEGGWADDPKDSGGPTMYGVTARLAKKYGYDNIISLTKDQAGEIMLAEFWKFDDVRDGRIAVKVFDSAVNLGLSGAVKRVQLAIKKLGYLIDVDGLVGVYTIRKLNEVNVDSFLEAFSQELENYYKAIAFRRPKDLAFLNGWKTRAWKTPVSVPSD